MTSQPTDDASPPSYIVLDSNMLMRLLVVGFATDVDVFGAAQEVGAKIELAPYQLDEVWRNLPSVFEVWRNLPSVFDEHVVAWKALLKTLRQVPSNANAALTGLGALAVDVAAASKAARALQTSAEALRLPDFSWDTFRDYTERRLDALVDLEARDPELAANLVSRAHRRMERRNPPTAKNKEHHLADCTLWELVLCLLRSGHVVWFASTDSDFLHANDHLHPFLEREGRRAGGQLRFFRESRDRGHNPGTLFRILESLRVSAEDAARFRLAADAVDLEEARREAYEERPGPGDCMFCGDSALVEDMSCHACGQNNHQLSGCENYSLAGSDDGGHVVYVEEHDGVAVPVECGGCGGTVFDVYFQGMCGWHQHMHDKHMRDDD